MAGLSDKLKALGVTIGARDLQPPAPTTEHPIEVVVDGSFQQTSAGDIFVIEQLYDTDYRHGQIGLWPTTSLNSIAQWAKDIRIPTYNLEQFAFIDTETTGLAGGTGTYAFLIGVGRFEGDKFRLAQFFMQDPAEEKAQLAALTEFLNPCEALVTFNGKSFDIPLINSRYITHRQQFPLPDAAHIDLLHLARRLWRDRLPSRTLSQLEIHILGANRTEEDTPGWMIPNLYFNYLRTGDARPLKGIFYHNALDILALAALLNHTAYLLTDPLSNSISHALDLVAIGKLFEDLGEAEVAIALFNEGLTRNDLPEESYWHIQQRLSLVYKRQGNLEQAVEVWSLAAEGKQLYAHIELAKFYEHQRRDYEAALQWTELGLTIVKATIFSRNERLRWQTELQHRLTRLQKKIGNR